jgi:hypothetical protein
LFHDSDGSLGKVPAGKFLEAVSSACFERGELAHP